MDLFDAFFGNGHADDETPDQEKARRRAILETEARQQEEAAAARAMERIDKMCFVLHPFETIENGQRPIKRAELEIIGHDTLRVVFWSDDSEFVADACFPLSMAHVATDCIQELLDNECFARVYDPRREAVRWYAKGDRLAARGNQHDAERCWEIAASLQDQGSHDADASF